MSLLRDVVYILAALVTAPVWGVYLLRTGKFRTDWAGRLGRTHLRPVDRPTVLIHAVSVGEVNAIRGLVDRLTERHRDEIRIVISATTNTGIAQARRLFEKRHEVVRFPFDLSWPVRRLLRQIRPDLVALVELELWPGFVGQCRTMGIPVIVVNGRLSERSFRGYRRFRFAVKGMFRRLTRACVQDEAYAERFRALGTPADRVVVTGTMKWDNAPVTDGPPGPPGPP
ncbi:MAG: 3-deoxy-D-manno-octulosonic acid transferase, partial [Alphaproteobacteria bacterium]|nr:3-deoxy-D-manno-octulosonic acid transferase [Alphaproteobacteria bacterium]